MKLNNLLVRLRGIYMRRFRIEPAENVQNVGDPGPNEFLLQGLFFFFKFSRRFVRIRDLYPLFY